MREPRRRGRKRAIQATEACTCPECDEPIVVGDLIVYWGYGRTGARHLRCVSYAKGVRDA